MKCPLQGIVIKGNFITTANGIMRIEALPDIKIPLPKQLLRHRIFEKLPDKYFFIGANCLRDLTTDGLCTVTNEYTTAYEYIDSYEEWIKSYIGKMVPFSFSDYMFVSNKEYINRHPHTKPIRIMLWDIEVCSDGSGVFPKASKNPIAMIGYKIIEYHVETGKYEDISQIEIIENFNINAVGLEDKEILQKFSEVMIQYNPDVICGYNSWKFDMPYVLERFEKTAILPHNMLDVPQELLSKQNSIGDAARSIQRLSIAIDIDSMRLSFGKRIHYDIYAVDVQRDGNLIGLKDRKMKTIVQKLYPDDDNIIVLEEGIENIYAMMQAEDTKTQLRKYLQSDIVQTERLCKFYFSMNAIQAEELNVPLSAIIGRRNGTIPTYYILSRLLLNKMIPLRPNSEVYSKLIHRATTKFKEVKLFQGAYVDIYISGKISSKITKVDFVSLYPNIIRTFNLSYETIKSVKFELIDGEVNDSLDSYSYHREGDDLTISFNDTTLHCRITLVIDQSKRGLVPQIMDQVLTERSNLKKKLKQIKDKNSVEYMQLDSQQLFMKIVANSSYGILSQSRGIGYLPVGMAITGMGRWMTKNICLHINNSDMETDKNPIYEF